MRGDDSLVNPSSLLIQKTRNLILIVSLLFYHVCRASS
jgi:hypothetical protein